VRRKFTILGGAALAAGLVVGLVIAVTPQASAQVEAGGGWTAYSPSFDVQRVGCGKVDGNTFQLTCSNSHGQQRAERRYATYSSGVHQFQGAVKIVSMGGTRISLKQTFKTSGPFFLLGIEKGGRLYAVHDDRTIATGVLVGTTVTVNTVHDVGRQLRVYINGSLRYTIASRSGSFYDKLGAYRTASGHGPITVQWTNVQFWFKK
jgi:hypothetical protein